MDQPVVNEQIAGYLRLPEVLRLIPMSKATWWAGCKTGQFPKPYKLSPRITAWKTSDIQQFINSRSASGQ